MAFGGVDQLLDSLKRRHEGGDPLAAAWCLVECYQRATPFPEWAMAAHALMWLKYLSGKADDLDDAYFGHRLDGGRHADPRRKQEEQRRYEDAHAAVRGAAMAGHRGESRFEAAVNAYNHRHPDGGLTVDQISKIHYRQQGRSSAQSYFLQDPTENAVACSGILHALRSAAPTPGANYVDWSRVKDPKK